MIVQQEVYLKEAHKTLCKPGEMEPLRLWSYAFTLNLSVIVIALI